MKPHYDAKFIRHMFEYTIAGDRAGFEAACTLAEAEYYKDRGFSFGSVHNVLCHQMCSMKGWLARFQGNPPTRLENHADYPTREQLGEQWQQMHRELMGFVSEQTDASVAAVMETRRTNGDSIVAPLGLLMMHAADHGTYHRGQLASMIKLAGGKPPYTPYLLYAINAEKTP